MTTRRAFIKTLAAVPPLLSFGSGWAGNDPSRLALIIGNSGYRDAPLVNPANDAKAVGGLFTEAGFIVDSRLNATRVDMMVAIERFGAAVKRSETKLVVFYYAGHGAQLDWRNYLLPVDAVVERQEHMKERCVDLSLLLAQFSAAKDKTFVVILDACRNNPFGRSYRPEQKGLSQFDAPVGSLLAYATSPGNVASDGEGANGLYTENLVRELSKRNTRIEDALKRVRLNVRLASHGAQIPWETTSLETDVFIFNEGQKKLTEAEEEKLLESDFAEWGRIKSSRKVADWVGYLRTFPNGRFAEIAQTRLTRLLADVEKQRLEREQQESAKAEKLVAETRQHEEQKRLELERVEHERIRVAEALRLAAERKQLEEQQLQELRRREEEQQHLEATRRREQERLDRERQRIVEAERLAEERRKQEQQRQLAEQKRLELAAAQRQKEDQQVQQEQKRLSEQTRLDQERMERERIRVVEAQRLAAERKLLEEQQLQEQRRREEEQQRLEAKRRQEQERLDRERQRIVEAEHLVEERKRQDRVEAERRRIEDGRRRTEHEKLALAKPNPTQAGAPASAQATPAATPILGAPMLEIMAGVPVPTLIAPSGNPFSAGRYPLGRIYTVGDMAAFQKTDILTGIEVRPFIIHVTRVDEDADRVEFGGGHTVTDLMGNVIITGALEYEAPRQWVPSEFYVGKKWNSVYRQIRKQPTWSVVYDFQIVKRETISVQAGTFDTFLIEGHGWDNFGNRLEKKTWMVPGLNFSIKSEQMSRRRWGSLYETDRVELVALRQQTIDTECATSSGDLKPTLVIKSGCG
ncbi:MAG: caspase family protein [Rhodocyclales bacterium]|nr:caspase family protein [Rhodocyclales bacterium]